MPKNNYERIRDYMVSTGNGLSVVDALKLFGTTELRVYVMKMRNNGINVDYDWIKYKDYYGIKHQFKRFYVKKEETINA